MGSCEIRDLILNLNLFKESLPKKITMVKKSVTSLLKSEINTMN